MIRVKGKTFCSSEHHLNTSYNGKAEDIQSINSKRSVRREMTSQLCHVNFTLINAEPAGCTSFSEVNFLPRL